MAAEENSLEASATPASPAHATSPALVEHLESQSRPHPKSQSRPHPAEHSESHPVERAESHAGLTSGLLLISLEKLVRGAFSLLIGLVALQLIHRNLGEVLLHTVLRLHLDPDGAMISRLMDRADLVSGHQLREAGMVSIGYACITVTEGIGLLRHKIWAEYMTLGLTLLALPLEIVAIARHPHWTRVLLLIINLLVVVYLVWLMRARGRKGH